MDKKTIAAKTDLNCFGQIDVALTGTINAYLKPFAENGICSGCIMVIQNGHAIVRTSFSFPENAPKKLKPDTQFQIGSLTKQFTATAIMIIQAQTQTLEPAQRLTVQDPVSKWIPDYPSGDEITIEHLLRHTSGIPNGTDLPPEQDAPTKTLDELIDRFKDRPLTFTPGSHFEYSNSGYILLTKIIEIASGLDYDSYLQKNIFETLGMTNTGVINYTKPNLATGYILLEEQRVPAGQQSENYSGAASLVSTIDDLYKWDQTLCQIRSNTSYQGIISQESLEEMYTPGQKPIWGVTPQEPSQYGYGYWIIASTNQVMHTGRVPGFCSMITRDLAQNRTIIILINNYDSFFMFEDIKNIVSGKKGRPLVLPEEETDLTADRIAQYDRHLGKYKIETVKERYVSISREGTSYYAQFTGTPKFRIRPEKGSTTKFFRKNTVYQLEAIVDKTRKTTGLECLTYHELSPKVQEDASAPYEK